VLAGPILDVDPSRIPKRSPLNGTRSFFLVQAARRAQRADDIVFLSSLGSRHIVPAYAAIGAASRGLRHCAALSRARTSLRSVVRITALPRALVLKRAPILFGGNGRILLARRSNHELTQHYS